MHLLFGNYYFSEIAVKEFLNIFNENESKVFDHGVVFDIDSLLSDNEKTNLKNLKTDKKDEFKLFIKITQNDNLVGWFVGRQTDEETFKMSNTGIFKEHQNKGLYSKLLDEILLILKAKGFQKIESNHHMSNNSVIIPKLKKGFVITGFNLDERYGMLIRLTYFFNEKRKAVVDFRTGYKKLS